MDNNTVGINGYANLLQQINSLLNITLPEIKNKYRDYPHCLIDYFEKDVTEKSIEIRFDKEEYTITCVFNKEGKCNIVYLFPDENETIEKCITYFKETYDYNFIKNRWKASDFYIKIKELTPSSNDICCMFFS
ncbi:hypothetical protein [Dysgonomonas sp. 511]|uniref:hypothetical protein n=1 Tax=Dysgonomonas sp. 511 TaxID=2302930 RepID=UPI0013CF9C33|nr:hypothetical protein [Dysgonomonas sp. 511]NDV80228.1 hypothetical protein [Dysgonomonas sp. 511]